MKVMNSWTQTFNHYANCPGVKSNCLPESPTVSTPERRFALEAVFEFLKATIPHDSWFIGGSAAQLGKIPFNDVDVFFADEEKAKEAIKALQDRTSPSSLFDAPFVDDILATRRTALDAAVDHAKKNVPVLITHMYQNSFMSVNATAKITNVTDPITIQLVTKNTGNYKDIFSRIDLNVCKIGILPNGKKVAHPTALSDLRISRLQHETMLRVIKYAVRLYKKPYMPVAYTRAAKDAIDRFIEDDTPAKNVQQFYQFQSSAPDNTVLLTNELLKQQILQVFTPQFEVSKYFREQALKRAPELLL